MDKLEYNFVVRKEYLDEQNVIFLFYSKRQPFDPNDPNDEIIYLDEVPNIADLLVTAEIYSSKNQAKKDGWNYKMPDGWFDKRAGKRGKRICCYIPVGEVE